MTFPSAFAQTNELKFSLVRGDGGRPIKKITAVSQDPQGFIWLCGQNDHCIYRYDGYHMVSFRKELSNPNSLGITNLETIFAAHTGEIWIGGDGLDRYDPATGIFKHYRHQDNDPESLGGKYVTAILKDRQGRVWIGTEKGLDRLDEKTGKFHHYRKDPGNPSSLSSNVVRSLYEDRQGVIWVGTGFPFFEEGKNSDGGLNRLNPDGSFTRYLHDPKDPASLASNKVKALFEDSRGNFWVGTAEDGLHLMDRQKGTFTRYPYNPAKPDQLSRPKLKTGGIADFITYIDEDSTGSLWIGTYSAGLNRYDTLTKKVTHFENSNGYPDSSCWNGFISRDGAIWICTEWSELLYKTAAYPQKIKNYLPGGRAGGFAEDGEGHIWVATDAGLMQYDQGLNLLRQYRHDPRNNYSLHNDTLNCLLLSGPDTIYVGGKNGIEIFNKKTGQFSVLKMDEPLAIYGQGIIWHIYRDRKGILWFASGDGAISYDSQRGSFKHYRHDPQDSGSISSNRVIRFLEDRSGNLWVGCEGGGINRLDPQSGHFIHYLSLYNGIFLYEDAEGTLWTGTNQGLYRFDKAKDQFVPFFETESSFNNEFIWGNMVEDPVHNLWCTTPSVIIRINPAKKSYRVYGKRYGIPPYNLHPNGNFITRDGRMLLGNEAGFYAVHPEELSSLPELKLCLTGFSIDNQPVDERKFGMPEGFGRDNDALRLTYNQNNIAFEFSAMDYTETEAIRFFTKLENYDDTWREAPVGKNAHYFSIPPGDYVFHVRAYDGDGAMVEKAIAIHVSPPWWQTVWAYVLYAILLSLAGYGLYRYQKQRIIARERQNAQQFELAQAKEIEKAYHELKATQAQLVQAEKMASLGELTAGIAHEIQNPLNFVNNFSEVNAELFDEMQLAMDKGDYQEAEKIAKTIQANQYKIREHGQRADAIVKSMLQHSRSSTGQKSPVDINKLVDEYVRLAYHGMRAREKNFNVTLHTDYDPKAGMVNAVAQDIGRVVLNLINNAFFAVTERKQKEGEGFVPTVRIITRKTQGFTDISVEDNGGGIPESIRDKIFQPFFTTKPTGQGTGLGLSLSYDIITKGHSGELRMQTKPGEGTVFTIRLPV